MNSSKVKVAVFRVVDQYTRANQMVIASMLPVSKPIEEAKAFFNEGMAKHFAYVAECEEYGPLSIKKAKQMIDAFQKATPCVLVFNLLGEERSAL